ncbi:anti-sigma factor domain-containing protein [Alicyclobacillus fastidiosus]|uniref:Anti-sigma factor domain-containing protein n=1 Tax=Alicyclobacillus fastidiosus TaxID=392011 RepID=A0ABV5AIW2_9BACL|nr:anti-sigma factor domain-containing protein [Alicyclobacillus fastidiosus]WEH11203.1 anti-sigma factor domain-containing protein [Alicyclobacillus fastidiosus]
MTNAQFGVVMEIRRGRAIVMTPHGAFERIKLDLPANVGDMVTLPVPTFTSHRLRVRSTVASVAAAVVVCAGLLHAIFIAPPKVEAYAFVSLDMSPSVSLDLSDHMTVLDVHGLNAAGKKLAKSLHVNGDKLSTAIRLVVHNTVQEGMLPANDTIIVAAAGADAHTDASEIEAQATSDVHSALKAAGTSVAQKANVYSMDVSSSVWNEAMKQDVSPGKYATYLLAHQVGVPVSLADINSSNIQMVLAQVHDLQTGESQLNTGDYSKVASIVGTTVSSTSSTVK